jgi:hypothetical protein
MFLLNVVAPSNIMVMSVTDTGKFVGTAVKLTGSCDSSVGRFGQLTTR